MFLCHTEPRRKRKVKSRIVHESRALLGAPTYSSEFKETTCTLFDISDSTCSKMVERPNTKIETTFKDMSSVVLDDMPMSLSRHDNPAFKKLLTESEEEVKILYDNDELWGPFERSKAIRSRSRYWSFISDIARKQSSASVTHARYSYKLSGVSSNDKIDRISLVSDDDMDIRSTEEDDNTLPPYYQIVPEMFFKFAGISPYSDSNLLQSKNDFNELLKCLGLESLREEFLLWFPEPKLVKAGKGYITFDMFCDMFSCKFAQTILEAKWQYETLCSAILTMKCLDKDKVNRIRFQQFYELCNSLYDGAKSRDDIEKLFKKYDTDGVGLLTVVNIYNFCCDEEEIED